MFVLFWFNRIQHSDGSRRNFDENFTSRCHAKKRKVSSGTWCHESWGLLWFFFSCRAMSCSFLKIIVIVTVINLLRRLKTSNGNHKFSSKNSFLFDFFFLLFFCRFISGWIEMIYFHLIINLSFSFHFQIFFSVVVRANKMKFAKFKSNKFPFMAQWLLVFSRSDVPPSQQQPCSASVVIHLKRAPGGKFSLYLTVPKARRQFSLFERLCNMSTWIKKKPLIWATLFLHRTAITFNMSTHF